MTCLATPYIFLNFVMNKEPKMKLSTITKEPIPAGNVTIKIKGFEDFIKAQAGK